MKACGLIVEYNPLHYGHIYHIKQARATTGADIIIAIMSGSFLQRGEPAIIDKIHRTKAALDAGVDIVLELPYAYAVQSSALFAKGAIFSLFEMGASSICFGSEAGEIEPFINRYERRKANEKLYDTTIKTYLHKGYAFPTASSYAYREIGLDTRQLHQPNNILGQSYVDCILTNDLPLRPYTIKRTQNDYHDTEITNPIASATSIRTELLQHHFSDTLKSTLPLASLKELIQYENTTNCLHTWEVYFPFLHFKVSTMSLEELRNIQEVEEGIEHRIKQTANDAKSFAHWLELVKTRRYTKTRLQRIFTHILTNTTKHELKQMIEMDSVPYIRMLGMNARGQTYVNQKKKLFHVPLLTRLNKQHAALLHIDEKATNAYYSILQPDVRKGLKASELQLPIRKQ